MTKEEFRYVWLKGWKIDKIAKHLGLDENTALQLFTEHFNDYFK